MSSLPKALKICIFTTNPAGIYSGGRYMSMMLAYALARAQADVTYITNIAPIFDADFDVYQTAEADCAADTKIVGPGFEAPPGYRADWVVVIPTGSFDEKFYDAALDQARQWQARVALISFETPNWFAATSPYARSALPTESWRRVVAQGGLVVTIARTGVPYAREYYGPARTDLRFGYWHPPVNDLMAAVAAGDDTQMAAIAANDADLMTAVAASVAASAADPALPRRIVCFVRTEDRHKGAQDLLALPPDLFDGHILALVFGRGVNAAYVTALRRHFASAKDFAVELHSQISDHAFVHQSPSVIAEL